MSQQTRITLEMSTIEAMTAMSAGNPGALNVLIALLEKAGEIDPDCAMGGLGHILYLDTCGIYGSRIWMLFKDVCKQDMSRMVALLRAVQLGFVAKESLSQAIDSMGDGLNIQDLVQKVQERLPNFVLTAA